MQKDLLKFIKSGIINYKMTIMKLTTLKLSILTSIINTEDLALLTLLKTQIANFEKGQAAIEKAQTKTVPKTKVLKSKSKKQAKNK